MRFRLYRFLGWLILPAFLFLLAGCSAEGTPTTSQGLSQIPAESDPYRSDSAVSAEGRVVPAQEAILSFTTSGVVAEVLVEEGDQVQAGQVLARLNGDEQLQAAVAAAELELLMAEQELEQLQNNASLERAEAQLALAQAIKELDKAEKRLLSKEYQRGDQEQVDIARANYIIAEDAVSKAEEIYDRVDDRPEDDPERANALSALAAARQTRDVALANLNYLLSKPNAMDVAEVDAQLALAQARLEEAQRRVNRLENGPDVSQLTLIQAKIKNAQMTLEAAHASLGDLELNAPFTGTIGSIEISNGEFVSPGMAVARLADQSTWFVETTDLMELDIARVKLGMPAFIRFDALPDVELIGRVTHIEAYGENRQGDIVYTVVLRLDQADPRLRWNMTAAVTFIEDDL